MPAPELLKKLLPALAAALGLHCSSVTRRYLVELHFLTAPELAKRVEPDDQTVIQPSQAEVHAVAPETAEEARPNRSARTSLRTFRCTQVRLTGPLRTGRS